MNAVPQTIVNLAPPFTRETAILKVRAVEDNWNSRDPERVARGSRSQCRHRTGKMQLVGDAIAAQ